MPLHYTESCQKRNSFISKVVSVLNSWSAPGCDSISCTAGGCWDKQQQQAGSKVASTPGLLIQPYLLTPSQVTLAFKEPALEARFRAFYNDRAAALDKHAVTIYMWMVALGSLLYLLIAAFLPSSRPANVDQCTMLIVCSWLGPAAHLLLLHLMPHATYVSYRTPIILALRAFYIGATSVNGFALCGVGGQKPLIMGAAAAAATLQPHGSSSPMAPLPLTGLQQEGAAAAVAAAAAAAHLPSSSPACPFGDGIILESPYSAMLWRSGIIGLIWWSCAFPLLFREHVVVQSLSLALYMWTLSPTVCATMHSVRGGLKVVSLVAGLGHATCAQLLAAVGAPRLALRHAGMAAAALAGSSSDDIGSSSGGSGGCVRSMSFLQLVLGLALPAFVKYCLEARKRRSWLQQQQQHYQHHQQQQLQPRLSSSSLTGSNSSSSLSSLEAAAMAALTAATAPKNTPHAEQADQQAAAADAAAAAADCMGAGSSSSSRSIAGSSNSGASSSSFPAGSPVGSSNYASLQQQQQLHDAPVPAEPLTATDEFAMQCHAADQPPSSKEVFVLLVVIVLGWNVLGQWLAG